MLMYGNEISNNGFTIDRIYGSKAQMNSAMAIDGIFIGRYVAINYQNAIEDTYKIYGTETNEITYAVSGSTYTFYQGNSVIATITGDAFACNKALDGGSESNNYTIWQKVCIDGQDSYQQLARVAGDGEVASQLATARTITLTGDVEGSVAFDGSQDVVLDATVTGLSNNTNTSIAYCTCTTSGDIAEKIITTIDNPNWTLTTGAMISVLFTHENKAENPTFNVNSTGTKNIYKGHYQITTSNLEYAGTHDQICNYIYDGEKFYFHSWGNDHNSQLLLMRAAMSAYNSDFPFIISETTLSKIGTENVHHSNTNVIGLVAGVNENAPTANPLTGEVKIKTLTIADKVSGKLDGLATNATKALSDNTGQQIDTTYLKTVYINQDNELVAIKGDNSKTTSQINNFTASGGSSIQPIYFVEGVPTPIDYTIQASVPADAVFKYDAVTSSTDGLMSSTDKVTLNTISSNYIKSLSASGQTITYIKGDNSTGTLTLSGALPEVTTANNGAFLRVVNGAWAATSLTNAEEVTF